MHAEPHNLANTTKELGAATIELALVLVVFLALTLGCLDFTQALLHLNRTTNEIQRIGRKHAVSNRTDCDADATGEIEQHLFSMGFKNKLVAAPALNATVSAQLCKVPSGGFSLLRVSIHDLPVTSVVARALPAPFAQSYAVSREYFFSVPHGSQCIESPPPCW